MTVTVLESRLPTHSDSAAPLQAVRSDIDSLHAQVLSTARNIAHLAQQLDSCDSHAAGGHARVAIGHIWRAAEELHTAFHTAPSRAAGPSAPLAQLCARRMRYLARAAKKAAS